MPACLFCKSSKLTKEHIWPVWIRDLFPTQDYDAARRSRFTGVDKTWKQSTIDRTCRCVCGPCNNGWMSEIETRVRPALTPLLLGRVPELGKGNQRRLAVWACLRFYILESSTDSNFVPYSSPAERLMFRTNHQRIPTGNTIVWLGMLPDDLAESAYNRIQTRIERKDAVAIYTCFIGRAAFQVLQWKGSLPTIHGSPINSTKLLHGWHGRLIEIWPNHFTGRKPFPRALTFTEAEALFARF